MYEIGKNSKIIANNIDIDDSVIIGNNVFIECDTVKIGKFSKIPTWFPIFKVELGP